MSSTHYFDAVLNMPRRRRVDPAAAALITILKGTDGWAGNAVKEAAINTLFTTMRSGGYLAKIVELAIPIFASATPNRRKWISLGQMTYNDNGGSFGHNADGVSFTGDAYIGSGFEPANLGQSAAANGTGVGFKTWPTQSGNAAHGANGGPGQVNAFPNYTGNTSYFRMGVDNSAGEITGINTSALAAGLLLNVRSSTANAAIYHFRWSNSAFSTLTTTTGLSGSAFPAGFEKYYNGLNNGGTAAAFLGTPIYLYVETLSINATEAEHLCNALRALLVSWGILA